jgi:hypothetical protein
MNLRAKSAWVLTVVFALGIIAGLGLAPLIRRPRPLPPSLNALGLRPDQRARVEAIIARHGPEIDAALGDARPRIRAIQERVATEIEAELDPDQRERFRRERQEHPRPSP